LLSGADEARLGWLFDRANIAGPTLADAIEALPKLEPETRLERRALLRNESIDDVHRRALSSVPLVRSRTGELRPSRALHSLEQCAPRLRQAAESISPAQLLDAASDDFVDALGLEVASVSELAESLLDSLKARTPLASQTAPWNERSMLVELASFSAELGLDVTKYPLAINARSELVRGPLRVDPEEARALMRFARTQVTTSSAETNGKPRADGDGREGRNASVAIGDSDSNRDGSKSDGWNRDGSSKDSSSKNWADEDWADALPDELRTALVRERSHRQVAAELAAAFGEDAL
ncbi:MAG: hypothetical protein AAF645_24335, partial [Myxococcota bacterium]